MTKEHTKSTDEHFMTRKAPEAQTPAQSKKHFMEASHLSNKDLQEEIKLSEKDIRYEEIIKDREYTAKLNKETAKFESPFLVLFL